ncbi:MAG TPA: hypothetical protein VGK89_06270 [Candidatus Eisenbacteria bacterium]|jgi:hypothetical protein
MRLGRLAALYRRHFRDARRERLFLSSASFFVTFGAARLLTHWSRALDYPFRVVIGQIHVHHLVWGIMLLLLAGYSWMILDAEGPNGRSLRIGRLNAALYGAGAALTLDEFALWLNLEDVYWEREGRASIDAVMLFGALISAGLWGGPFFRAVTRHASRLFRRHAPSPR